MSAQTDTDRPATAETGDEDRLATDVAAELGHAWQSVVDDDVTVLTGPDGAQLRLYACEFGSKSGQLFITGMVPAYRPRGDLHEISVRRDRGPVVIAAEIRRRLLPDYLPDLAQAHADLETAAASRRARRQLRDQLARILPSGSARRETPWDLDRTVESNVSFHRADVAGFIRICGDLTTWEIRADAPIALTLAELLSRDPDVAAPADVVRANLVVLTEDTGPALAGEHVCARCGRSDELAYEEALPTSYTLVRNELGRLVFDGALRNQAEEGADPGIVCTGCGQEHNLPAAEIDWTL